MARRRFQSGWLFKSGRRRKVWVGRWREDALLPDGTIGEIHRSAVLGLVADIPTRREAQLLLDAKLLPVNQGTARPEAFVAFGAFVEQQWKTLVFPTFKASTQHGYQTVLNVHVLSTTLNIYTHVVDASHRKAVEEVEERLFGDLARNGPKLAVGLENATPASRSVN